MRGAGSDHKKSEDLVVTAFTVTEAYWPLVAQTYVRPTIQAQIEMAPQLLPLKTEMPVLVLSRAKE